jgi:hypothetical protein
MDIIKRSKEKYGIQKVGNKHRIIKVLKEYDNEHDAVCAMTQLMTGAITEQDLLKEEK